MAKANEISQILIAIRADVSDLQNKFKTIETTNKKIESSIGGVFKGLKENWIGLTGAVAVGVITFNKFFNDFLQYKKNLAEVSTLLNITKEEFSSLDKELKKITRTIPQTANELAKAAYDVVSAGVEFAKVPEVLEKSAKAAVAGVTDTKTAFHAGIAVINAYGKSIEELDDVYEIFFKTIKYGITTFPELSQNIGQVLPTANAAGVAFNDVASSIALMTKAGIDTPMATVALNRAISSLAAPTGIAKKAMDELGITWQGFIPTLQQLFEKTKQIPEDKMLAFMRAIIPEERASKAILTLVNNLNGLNEIVNDVDGDNVDKAYDKMADTPANQIVLLINVLKELRDTILELVPLTAFFKSLTKAAQAAADVLKAFKSREGKIEVSSGLKLDMVDKELKKLDNTKDKIEYINNQILKYQKQIDKYKEKILDTPKTATAVIDATKDRIAIREKTISELESRRSNLRKIPLSKLQKGAFPVDAAALSSGGNLLNMLEEPEKAKEKKEELRDISDISDVINVKMTTSDIKDVEDYKKIQDDIKDIRASTTQKLKELSLSEKDFELFNLKSKYDEERSLLEENNESLLELNNLYDIQRRAIEDKYYQDQKKKQKEHLVQSIEMYMGFANTFLQAMSGFTDARIMNLENEKNAEINNIETSNYTREKQQELIEKVNDRYDRQLRLQHQRNKRFTILQITLNGALAIMKGFAELGPILGAINAVAMGLLVGSQIAVANAQKYGSGGSVQGKSHASGGVQAELEGGEYVLKKKAVSYYGTQFIESLNQLRLNKNTLPISFGNRITAPIGKFESGGLVTTQDPISNQFTNVTVANFLDPLLFDKFLNSFEGERAIINLINRNSFEIKNALLGA